MNGIQIQRPFCATYVSVLFSGALYITAQPTRFSTCDFVVIGENVLEHHDLDKIWFVYSNVSSHHYHHLMFHGSSHMAHRKVICPPAAPALLAGAGVVGYLT